ncbi:hypothetical protein BKA81DRAFT_376146 [Phyllosticta paracitricarpa]
MPGAGAKARRPSRRARVRISRERNPGEPEKWLKPKRHTPRAPWKRRKARREKEAAAAAADDTTVAAQMYIEPTNDDTHDDSEELEGEDESDEGDDQEEKRESGCDSEEYIRVPVRIVKDRDLLLGLPSSRKVALEFSAPFSELEAYDLKADVIKGTKIDSTLRAISSRAAVPAELKERSSAILRKWEAASASPKTGYFVYLADVHNINGPKLSYPFWLTEWFDGRKAASNAKFEMEEMRRAAGIDDYPIMILSYIEDLIYDEPEELVKARIHFKIVDLGSDWTALHIFVQKNLHQYLHSSGGLSEPCGR